MTNDWDSLHPIAAQILRESPGQDANERGQLLRIFREVAGDVAAEAALQVLERMDEATGVQAGMACANHVRESGAPAQLERLQAARARLPSFPGWRDWRADVDGAIAALESLARGNCACASVRLTNTGPGGPLFEELGSDPEKPGASRVRCRRCQLVWSVEVDDSYHYPIYRWF
jgi:hypothetical protein